MKKKLINILGWAVLITIIALWYFLDHVRFNF